MHPIKAKSKITASVLQVTTSAIGQTDFNADRYTQEALICYRHLKHVLSGFSLCEQQTPFGWWPLCDICDSGTAALIALGIPELF